MAQPQDKIVKIVSGSNPTIEATVASLTSSNPQHVSIVDANGDQITDFGQVEGTGLNGGPVTVGTTAVEMTFTGTTQAISLMSDADNTGKIWWGLSNVDSSGNNALGRLTADREVTIELNDSSTAVYAVSDTASQTVI